MNRILFALTLGMLMLPINLKVFSNCEGKECSPVLGNYLLLKSFKLDIDAATVPKKFKIVLSKGTRYKFSGCSGSDAKLIYELSSSSGFRFSNYNKSANKFYPSFHFICKRTEIYSLSCHFEGNKQGCGALLIAFPKIIKMSTGSFK